MTKKAMTLLLAGCAVFATAALADNALTTDQLTAAAQNALKDYATTQPDMSKSISGFRVTTVSENAQVVIQMNSDGMSMSAKYVCAPQGRDMSCSIQQ